MLLAVRVVTTSQPERNDWVTDSGAAGGNIITGSEQTARPLMAVGFYYHWQWKRFYLGNLLDSWVFSEGGNDTISLAGSGNFIFAGDGNDRIQEKETGCRTRSSTERVEGTTSTLRAMATPFTAELGMIP